MKQHFITVILSLIVFSVSSASEWLWPVTGRKTGENVLYAPQTYIDHEPNANSLFIGGEEGDEIRWKCGRLREILPVPASCWIVHKPVPRGCQRQRVHSDIRQRRDAESKKTCVARGGIKAESQPFQFQPYKPIPRKRFRDQSAQ